MSLEPPISPQRPAAVDVSIPRSHVWAWAFWDWGSSAYVAIVNTFVFSVYLTSSRFGDENELSAQLGYALAIAGLVIALFAPVSGRRSDRTGRRKLWLGIHSLIVIGITASLFFVKAEPSYLLLGLILVSLGTVFFEFAQVNYNAMLSQVSTENTIGRVSGFGWGMGYIAGVILLSIILVGFIFPEVGWFGVTAETGLNVRAAMLVAAAWFLVFAIPVMITVPEFVPQSEDSVSPQSGSTAALTAAKPARIRRVVTFWRSYIEVFNSLRAIRKSEPSTLWFLLASAIFRDGLVGVFAFGGIIAAQVFGFSPSLVIVFAIVANLVAGAFTLVGGRFDDRFGGKSVMVTSLIIAMLAGLLMFALSGLGPAVFWVTGLALAAVVGPIQSSSRAFLLRLTPVNQEGELFGLYAATGRAVSFTAPFMFAVFVSAFGSTIFGMLGIALVLLAGLLLLIPVKSPARSAAAAQHTVSNHAAE